MKLSQLYDFSQNKTTWYKHVVDGGATPFSLLILMHAKQKRKNETFFVY